MNKENEVFLEGTSPVTQKRVTIYMRSATHDPGALKTQEQICRMATDCLGANEIELQIVNPELDSDDSNLPLTMTVLGNAEENFRKSLSKKVHRGLEGRIRQRLSAGSSCFGYRSVPVIDDAHRGQVLGHKLKIFEPEAAIVQRVFYLFGTRIV
jgi:hypothetical protein